MTNHKTNSHKFTSYLRYFQRVLRLSILAALQLSFLKFLPGLAFAAPTPGDGGDGGGDGAPDGGDTADDNVLDFGGEAKSQDLPGSAETDPNDPKPGFELFIGNLLTMVMTIALILVLINLVIGALEWISAAGDSGKLQKARGRIMQSILGVIVLSATVSVFMIVQQFLGICALSVFDSCVI